MHASSNLYVTIPSRVPERASDARAGVYVVELWLISIVASFSPLQMEGRVVDWTKVVQGGVCVCLLWGMCVGAGFFLAWLVQTDSMVLFTLCVMYGMLPLCGLSVWMTVTVLCDIKCTKPAETTASEDETAKLIV